ncbi:GPI inositol-deacylase [Massilia agilis]|uniref:GPI inositol-deacylase n=1 Tax=Massilia agilis TaxID=1811226 RepID=A0ABT2DB56_9BURK|nr:GPI inositol-deacylase [Massilia agilis]MCS0808558.1 GPI inositol-deacylase [Massilia agilis]
MSNQYGLNERGNHQGQFSQGVGGWAEYTVHMTEVNDTKRHDVKVPPGKVIPVIFLPGVMGSNLRMSKMRQDELKRDDNRAWRPDDLMTVSGKIDVVAGNGMGNWFKNATPKQRQLVFDPNETEVEYYHYTESNDRFDPDGKETLAADLRHGNVPDSLGAIPPLLGRPAPFGGKQTPAQIARWRGWSEVLFDGAYGEMLKTAEAYLNNMISSYYERDVINPMWNAICVEPSAFGGASGAAISESDLKKISACWYPVHAMGYNFLQSNGKSAVAIAERIRGLVKGYQKRGFKCDEVIIVTHSMGGLVARAILHPNYGNLLGDKTVKVLGIYHNVMPTMGAGSAYKRMRFGFQEKPGVLASIEAKILGINGKHATAILANTPAPLELLPGAAYGNDWLRVIDDRGKTLWSWPRSIETALDSIYLKADNAWWRLVNPKWVNPAGIKEANGGGLRSVRTRLRDAADFLQSIERTFHPENCYASFCASSERLTYGEVVFQTQDFLWQPGASQSPLPAPETWTPLDDDAKGKLTVQAGDRKLFLMLQPPTAPGDETVPADRSARLIPGTLFAHGKTKGHDYEHQASYSDPDVLKSMLYSIVQIAKTAKWG